MCLNYRIMLKNCHWSYVVCSLNYFASDVHGRMLLSARGNLQSDRGCQPVASTPRVTWSELLFWARYCLYDLASWSVAVYNFNATLQWETYSEAVFHARPWVWEFFRVVNYIFFYPGSCVISPYRLKIWSRSQILQYRLKIKKIQKPPPNSIIHLVWVLRVAYSNQNHFIFPQWFSLLSISNSMIANFCCFSFCFDRHVLKGRFQLSFLKSRFIASMLVKKSLGQKEERCTYPEWNKAGMVARGCGRNIQWIGCSVSQVMRALNAEWDNQVLL